MHVCKTSGPPACAISTARIFSAITVIPFADTSVPTVKRALARTSRKAAAIITLSYIVNLVVLIPLLSAFALQPANMDPVFGPATDARRILVCLYASIALASVAGLTLIAIGEPDLARQIGFTLFSLQIIYKLMTVPMVGLSSPIVITNVTVAAIHMATLITAWRS